MIEDERRGGDALVNGGGRHVGQETHSPCFWPELLVSPGSTRARVIVI
jgi:hypothetical protein